MHGSQKEALWLKAFFISFLYQNVSEGTSAPLVADPGELHMSLSSSVVNFFVPGSKFSPFPASTSDPLLPESVSAVAGQMDSQER